MDFGKAIRTVRAARNISQKDLAAQADVSASYISLVEAGERTPSTNALASISRALCVPQFLLALLASEKEDLKGIRENDAQVLGSQLLTILTDD